MSNPFPGKFVAGDVKQRMDEQQRDESETDPRDIVVKRSGDEHVWVEGNRIENDEWLDMTGDFPENTC